MTSEQESFAEKWHYKIVKPTGKFQIPSKEYAVTSALLNWEDGSTIFAVKALDYSLENKHWFTLKLSPAEVEILDQDFEVVRDGAEELKPKILHEAILIWMVSEDSEDEWCLFTRSLNLQDFAYEPHKGKVMVKKADVTRIKNPCVEYMFIYKSIYDIERPSCYIAKVPAEIVNLAVSTDKLFMNLFEFVSEYRRDISDGKVLYGINTRLEEK